MKAPHQHLHTLLRAGHCNRSLLASHPSERKRKTKRWCVEAVRGAARQRRVEGRGGVTAPRIQCRLPPRAPPSPPLSAYTASPNECVARVSPPHRRRSASRYSPPLLALTGDGQWCCFVLCQLPTPSSDTHPPPSPILWPLTCLHAPANDVVTVPACREEVGACRCAQLSRTHRRAWQRDGRRGPP